MVLALKNILSYKIRYRNRENVFQPLHLSTYMWKGVTGVLLNAVKIKKEVCFSDLQDYQAKKLGMDMHYMHDM